MSARSSPSELPIRSNVSFATLTRQLPRTTNSSSASVARFSSVPESVDGCGSGVNILIKKIFL
jgi:hypothetical protein